MNNLYVEELYDYVITEMINMLCNDKCRLFVHNYVAYLCIILDISK